MKEKLIADDAHLISISTLLYGYLRLGSHGVEERSKTNECVHLKKTESKTNRRRCALDLDLHQYFVLWLLKAQGTWSRREKIGECVLDI